MSRTQGTRKPKCRRLAVCWSGSLQDQPSIVSTKPSAQDSIVLTLRVGLRASRGRCGAHQSLSTAGTLLRVRRSGRNHKTALADANAGCTFRLDIDPRPTLLHGYVCRMIESGSVHGYACRHSVPTQEARFGNAYSRVAFYCSCPA
jgi:hypothetical protein